MQREAYKGLPFHDSTPGIGWSNGTADIDPEGVTFRFSVFTTVFNFGAGERDPVERIVHEAEAFQFKTVLRDLLMCGLRIVMRRMVFDNRQGMLKFIFFAP